MLNRKEIDQCFEEVDKADSPVEAIRMAKEISAKVDKSDVKLIQYYNSLLGCVLIDCGAACKDKNCIDEGYKLFKELFEVFPDHRPIQYNLGNAIAAMARLVSTKKPQWYIETFEARRESRKLYQIVGLDDKTPPNIASRAFVNLGNSLLEASRMLEAYEYFVMAAKIDPKNGMALLQAAQALLKMARLGMGDSSILRTLAKKYLTKANEDPDRIRQISGEEAYIEFNRLMGLEYPICEMPDLTDASDYQKFVAKYRLALSPTLEGLDLSMKRWDSLVIKRVSVKLDEEEGVPAIFSMFNVIKADYLLARYLTYIGLNNMIDESGNYADTLDYARYGINISAMNLAQRSCIDLLDKIAVATSEYLRLPGNISEINFYNRWFDKKKGDSFGGWQKEIQTEIDSGNPFLVAISEVSSDLNIGGFLRMKKEMRRSSTHRFAIVHDIGEGPLSSNRYIDHYSESNYINNLIETLQLSRAVMFYFVGMIHSHEKRFELQPEITGMMEVPDHWEIRGQDV